jgi:hypothetical protein
MTQPVFETTATALREKSKLQRHFRRFDVFFYLICTVVFSCRTRCPSPNSAPRSRRRGPLRLEPAGVRAPAGRHQLGDLLDLQPDLDRRVAHDRVVRRDRGVLRLGRGRLEYVYAVAFIWFTIVTAIVSLRHGKWVPTLGAWPRGAVLTFFVVSVTSPPCSG